MRPLERWPPPVDVVAEDIHVPRAPVVRRRFPWLNAILLLATLASTTLAGALNDDVAIAELRTNWVRGLPFSLTLMAILLAHEMGHYFVARRNGVAVTLPFFLPAPPFLTGTFGAFIRMRSAVHSRRVLFDVGAAGPWAGIAVALPAVLYGLHLSELKPLPPTFSGLQFGDSLLFSALSRLVVGPIPHGFDILLHPVALAGWFGFLVTLLNLLPVGQLDGGHVVYAMFGRTHRWISRAFVLATVAFGFMGWAGWFLWAAMMVMVGVDHPPTLDHDSPLDPLRWVAGWMTLVLLVLTFVPVPITMLEGGTGPAPTELIPAMIGLVP